MKKLTCLMLVLVLMVCVIGCGGASGEVSEIHFWDMQWGSADVYDPVVESLVNRFNEEHPNIHVTYQIHNWDNYYQDYLTAVTSGMAPDVTNGAFNQSIQYAVMGELIDLSSIVDEWKESGFYDNFPEGAFELHTYNDMQVGIPWIQDPRMGYYNKRIFEEAGVTEIPTTWDELREAFVAIKEKTGVTPMAMVGIGNDSTQIMYHWMFSAGVGMTDEEGNAYFNSPEVIKLMEFLGGMMDDGLIAKGSAGYTVDDVISLFATGEIAYYIGNPSGSTNFAAMVDDVGVMEPITMETGMQQRGLTWLNPMVAYKQGKDHEASKTFIKWWVENNTEVFTVGKANFSANLEVNNDPFFSEDPIFSQVLNNVLPYSTAPTWPTPYLYEAFSQIDGELYVGHALGEILTGGRDYQAIADKYNQKIADAIADF